jgi:rhodanese-related sulfurtransferase
MKTVYSLVFFVLVVNLGCSQSKSKPINEFLNDIPADVVLIDVRTPQEFKAGHLKNAQNINWFDTNFVQQFDGIDKEKTIYLYCKVGGRSGQAQEKLLSLGYKNVVNLEGGYDAVLALKN